MTHAAGGAVHEHRTDRRGEWIRHRESFESVIADELLSSVSCEFSLRTGFDHAGGEQRFLDVMPAPRARVRVRAFLRDARCFHQPAIDVSINSAERINDLLGIILRDYGHRFFFALRRFKTEMANRLCRRAYRRLIHWPHWL